VARRHLAFLIGCAVIGCHRTPEPPKFSRGFVGLRYPPLPAVLELFSLASLRGSGEPRDTAYLLEWVRWPEGDEVWLSRRRPPAQNGRDHHNEVRAVLRVGPLGSTEAVSLTECEVNGLSDVRVLGVGPQHASSLGTILTVREAWLANTRDERFDRLPKREVACAGVPNDD
jgi:hypothetical protein